MKIAIGSDKSGFQLKEAVKAYLAENNYECEDLGTLDPEEAMPFFEVAPKVAEAVQSGTAERGILCCGTGMGMSIVANKHKGIVAACCESVYAAKMCRAVNDANILCMGGWLIADWQGIQMTKMFLETEFTQDLEPWRKGWLTNAKAKVIEFEQKQFFG